jgi:uncharacterized membrane protein YpjA
VVYLLRSFERILENEKARNFVVLVNLIGTAYGFYYYAAQLIATPLLFWIFVPDCPLYTLLFAVLLITGTRSTIFRALVFTGLVKYGVWTLSAILLYPQFHTSLHATLFVLHIGMVAQGFAIKFTSKMRWFVPVIVAGWFLLNDYVDYALGHHPWLPSAEFEPIMLSTIALSVVIPLGIYLYSRRM